LAQDSVILVQAEDSLRRTALRKRLKKYLQVLGITSMEGSANESYRVIVEFAWGKSPVGSHLVIYAARNEGGGELTVKSLPALEGQKKLNSKEPISHEDFQRIAEIFATADFEHRPVAENVDYVVYDASMYIVEQVAGGRYYGISRSSAVDPFIYQLLIELLNTASEKNIELVNEFERLSTSGN
jgi:hypothetical protein